MNDANETAAPAGMGLTERQREALVMITAWVGNHGMMPSRRQLAAAMGCSPNNAVRLMHGLAERGELNSISPGGPLTGSTLLAPSILHRRTTAPPQGTQVPNGPTDPG